MHSSAHLSQRIAAASVGASFSFPSYHQQQQRRAYGTTRAARQGFHRGDALGYSGVEGNGYNSNADLAGEDGAWDDGSSGYEWKSRLLAERRGMAMNYLGDVRKRVPIHKAVKMRAQLNRERLMEGLADREAHQHFYRPVGRDNGAYAGEEEDRAVAGNVSGSGDAASEAAYRTAAGGGPRMVLNEDSPAAVLAETLRASHYNPALDVHAPMGSDTAARLAVAAAADPITADMLSGGFGPAAASASPTSAGDAIAAGRRAARDAIDLVEEELEDLVADEGVLEMLAAIPPEQLRELRHEFYGGAPETSAAHADSTDATLREWLKLRKESSLYHSFASVPAAERREWSAWYLRDVRSHRPLEED